MTTAELLKYYADLLILQYVGKPKAHATIEAVVAGPVMDQLPIQVQDGFDLVPDLFSQQLVFSAPAVSGSFSVTVGLIGSTTDIAWNASLVTIQSDFDAVFGSPGVVTVSGGVGSVLLLSYAKTSSPELASIASNNLLDGSGSPVVISVYASTAQGVQLDVLGKYCGVTRSGFGPNGPITLDDADFLKLIQMAIISNTNPSDLATIVGFLFRFFPNQIFVFDRANLEPMTMSYLISTGIGSTGLLQLFISEGLLPRPMAVGIGIIAFPVIDTFFGFCDYDTATPTQSNAPNRSPFNTATSYTSGDYSLTFPWLDYRYSL